MNLTWSGCSRGELPQVILSDFPAGVPVNLPSLTSDVRRYLKALQALDLELDIRVIGGISHGKTTGEPVVVSLPGLESLAEENSYKPLIPRPGRGDLFALLASDADDMASAQAWSREIFELQQLAAASFAQEYIAALGASVMSFTTGVGSCQLDLDAVDVSQLDLAQIEMTPYRAPRAEFADQIHAEILRADAEGYSPSGSFCLVISDLLPAFGGRGRHALTAGLAQALMSIEGVVGVQFLQGKVQPQSPAELISPLRADMSGLSYERNGLNGIESYWNTGGDITIQVQVRPDMRCTQPLPSFDFEQLAACSFAERHVPALRVLSAALAAEAQIALYLADLYAMRFGSSSLAVTQAGVRAFQDRLRALAR